MKQMSLLKEQKIYIWIWKQKIQKNKIKLNYLWIEDFQ